MRLAAGWSGPQPDATPPQGIWKYSALLFCCHDDVGQHWHLVGKGQGFHKPEVDGTALTRKMGPVYNVSFVPAEKRR